ncbi:MAG TPA: hypothetical protein VN930_00220 [Xanthobacteraceae bacterium]|nr:hypothetical protein [Xanthobacteraceae bacterium]
MWLGVGEFLWWSVLGLGLGFVAHWWRANAGFYPEKLDKDDALFTLAGARPQDMLEEQEPEYDEEGNYNFYSVRNLQFYLWAGASGVLGAVYFSATGHAAARDGICKTAAQLGFVPLFCGA